MARLGVLGWPVAHSRSPQMHAAALAELGLNDWTYQRLPVPPGLFCETTRALPGAGFLGANVTIPHKEAALELADSASEVARAIGAANTLTFTPDGAIAADNTDAPGFLAALGRDARGLSALVLGAGGSARAVAWALREAGAGPVWILNRTHERAQALALDLGLDAVKTARHAEVLVNCTSVGLERSASEVQTLNQLGLTIDAVGEYSYVIDLVYKGAGTTPLLEVARRHGVETVDGLEVLVAQGALSLESWTGRPVSRDAMRAGASEPQQVR